MFRITDYPWKPNGNTLQEEVSIFQCIHGEVLIHVTTKVVSWLISNPYAVITSTMVMYMQGKLAHTNQTNMDCMICRGTFPSGHVVHTILQLIFFSTTFSQIMNIMQNPTIHLL